MIHVLYLWYDVCNQVIRLFVHLETAVEIIHDTVRVLA